MSFDLQNLTQNIERENLMQLVPHRGKMFLLSRIVFWSVDDMQITAEYEITRDCIFYEEESDGIPSYAGFEIMAQSIAALGSIRRIINRVKEPASPGVVLSLSSFRSTKDFLKAGTTIITKVRQDFEGDDIYKYSCELYESKDSEEPCVTTEITVMEMKNMELFFKERQTDE